MTTQSEPLILRQAVMECGITVRFVLRAACAEAFMSSREHEGQQAHEAAWKFLNYRFSDVLASYRQHVFRLSHGDVPPLATTSMQCEGLWQPMDSDQARKLAVRLQHAAERELRQLAFVLADQDAVKAALSPEVFCAAWQLALYQHDDGIIPPADVFNMLATSYLAGMKHSYSNLVTFARQHCRPCGPERRMTGSFPDTIPVDLLARGSSPGPAP